MIVIDHREFEYIHPRSAFHLLPVSVGKIHQNRTFFTTRTGHCERPTDMIILVRIFAEMELYQIEPPLLKVANPMASLRQEITSSE